MAKKMVAIVGRPNVGKSTLFNTLAGERLSIVKDTPGVTRDRIYADVEWLNNKFTIIDTGGIDDGAEDIIMRSMKEQAEIAIETSDVIVFVTDVRAGVTAADIQVADMLRKSKKPVVLCVNKVDDFEKFESFVYEFYNLGIGDPYPVSAANRQGLGDMLEKVVEELGLGENSGEYDDDEDTPKIAVIGKPNTGKSSMINRLIGSERLIVSNIAGTTRDAIDTRIKRNGREYIFIDTAGLRRKSKIKDEIERYSIIRTVAAVERCDIAILVIDAEEGVTEQDTKIAGIAHERGKGMIIVVNKWDLVEKETNTMKKMEKEIRQKLAYMPYAEMLFVSALTGQRLNKLYETIDNVEQYCCLRVQTGVLNEILAEAVAENEPPNDKGKRLKLFYITQVSVKPPTFVLFVNSKELAHFSYVRYIENKLREAFIFKGTPVRIIIRERKEKEL
ncbi:MAG: ribosome biogenesis GTPase Der [Eubacterium sp.]|nr:ribosome biogenesis GTPase Der [Eubacterium sp.]